MIAHCRQRRCLQTEGGSRWSDADVSDRLFMTSVIRRDVNLLELHFIEYDKLLA